MTKGDIEIPKKTFEKYLPWVLGVLLGAGGWQGHALVAGNDTTRIAVLESRMDGLQADLGKINDKLDRLLERRSR